MRQATMTVDEQIAYLRDSKGVTFDLVDEDYARRFLEEKNYFFKVKAFAKNYPKVATEEMPKGVYKTLDFGHLVELSKLDKCLRDLVLNLTLDIEHYLKVRTNCAAMRSGVNPYELTERYFVAAAANVVTDQKNRFSIEQATQAFSEVAETVNALPPNAAENPEMLVDVANSITKSLELITKGSKPEYARDSIAAMKGSAYSGDLVEKYQGRDMPYWCLMELMSFGQVIAFYKACFKKDGLIDDAVEIQFCKSVKNLLRHAQQLRNAAAHGDCLLNGLAAYSKSPSMSGVRRALADFGIAEADYSDVKSVQVAMDLAAILLCYDLLIPEGSTRQAAVQILKDSASRMLCHRDWFESNYSVKSFLDFFEMVSAKFVNALDGR